MPDKSKLVGALNALKRIAEPIRAYHGTPHKFDRFDISKIGEGYGNQAYGYGLYFAEKPEVALDYQRRLGGGPLQTNIHKKIYDFMGRHDGAALSTEVLDTIAGAFGDKERLAHDLRRIGLTWKRSELPYQQRYADGVLALSKNQDFIDAVGGRYGHMYDVNLHVPREHLLDWDAPLSKQPTPVQAAIHTELPGVPDVATGKQVVDALKNRAMSSLDPSMRRRLDSYSPDASLSLRASGIPGIQYIDRSSRGAGYGTRNFVMFDDAPIEIVRRYARGGLNSMKETSNG